VETGRGDEKGRQDKTWQTNWPHGVLFKDTNQFAGESAYATMLCQNFAAEGSVCRRSIRSVLWLQ
jgi:hypothetical protein